MTPAELVELLRQRLSERQPVILDPPGTRRAAVIAPLVFKEGEPHVLFTKRTEDVPSHKGQFSFPGGVIEPEDGGPLAAALRETEEEIGVPPEQIEVIGQLDDMTTRSVPFVITPFLGVLPDGLAHVTSDREVARILEVPLAGLLDEANREVDPRSGHWQYRWGEDIIWGATARMLTGLLAYTEQAH